MAAASSRSDERLDGLRVAATKWDDTEQKSNPANPPKQPTDKTRKTAVQQKPISDQSTDRPTYYLGTIVQHQPRNNTARIRWDNGETTQDHSIDKLGTLIVVDCRATAKEHAVACTLQQECGTKDVIRGFRFRCLDCGEKEINLCGLCYHADKHDTKHNFQRIVCNSDDTCVWNIKTIKDPRHESNRKPLDGVDKGATVCEEEKENYGAVGTTKTKEAQTESGKVSGLVAYQHDRRFFSVVVKYTLHHGLLNPQGVLKEKVRNYDFGYKGFFGVKRTVGRPENRRRYYLEHLPTLATYNQSLEKETAGTPIACIVPMTITRTSEDTVTKGEEEKEHEAKHQNVYEKPNDGSNSCPESPPSPPIPPRIKNRASSATYSGDSDSDADYNNIGRCIVTSAFSGSGIKQLQLSVGDIVDDVTEHNDEWLQGTLNTKKGYFPRSKVQMLSAGEQEDYYDSADEDASLKERKARVLQDFPGGEPEQLPLKVGDVVESLSVYEEDHSWFHGKLNGKEGYFPHEHVKIFRYKTELEGLKEGQARVLTDYVSDEPMRICLSKGDLVENVEEHGEQWFRGNLGGKTGYFPRKHVQLGSRKKQTEHQSSMRPISGNNSANQRPASTHKVKSTSPPPPTPPRTSSIMPTFRDKTSIQPSNTEIVDAKDSL